MQVLTAVVTDKPGQCTLHVGSLDSVSSVDAQHVERHGGEVRVIAVPGVTLDEIVESEGIRPGLLKIDVESHELAVLHGARRTLHEWRPAILIEVVTENASVIDAMLVALGYGGRRFADGQLVPLTEPLVPGGHAYADLLYEVKVAPGA